MHGDINKPLTLPAHHIHEQTQPWPFPSIDPHQFWALKIKDRSAIESAVAVLIEKLQPFKPKPD
ncbi:hypothetical protein [Castellaniella sp.]|nr:hypothetical protein [Castellaniella sp.]